MLVLGRGGPCPEDCSSSFALPAISLPNIIFGEIFEYVTVSNLTIEVVTFRLRGWCMLSAFLLLHSPV